ncbi:MAG: queuosine salvage family protein [Myxococcota bacterium]|nr:queuosine salvage family protein [Myxococcota bacterium]
MSGDVLDRIRERCAQVMERATRVRIDPERLEKLGPELATTGVPAAALDPAHHFAGDDESTLAFVLTLDAVNFGSGWFPLLRKRRGLSGYFTVATSLKERFEREGPWSAGELSNLDTAACTRVFGQEDADPGSEELMALFATALRDLGGWLEGRFEGRFAGPVEAAGGSAARLVTLLAEMPLYRDVSRHGELEVPFYKRAQLTCADLSAAFAGEGHGRFHDLERLTCFADNLVPHVLRREGVLVYADDLARRIDGEELLTAGSPEEVEIRAAAVHVVERLVEGIRRAGGRARALDLDFLLWNRGQRPDMKAHPRHRARTTFY